LLLITLATFTYAVQAQDTTKTDPPLVLSGSVDTYFKYDFAKHSNIPTSFASDQNSISIGMIDLALKKKVGKAAFVGEMSFGPRGQAQSIPNDANDKNSYHVQNLYVSYDVTDKFNLTGGYMATFMGYEVISPVGNFNYSTSYLFTNGPFQNAGFKATYLFSDKASLMAGIFNDAWNLYTSVSQVNTFGAQLMVAPAKGWTAYINLLTGKLSGTEIDLTTSYQITDAFKLGLNAADFSAADAVGTGGFSGIALYPQVAVAKSVTLGLRGEYFKTKTGSVTTFGPAPGSSVTAFTLTANIKSGPLTLIPELRLDNNKSLSDGFTKSGGITPTKSASQFVLAAVYSF
ncbi:MAG: hypothetical protein JWP67_600, partial [Mucilaginibacter sp.]|nr:hypothetical protein [Mucilaginibacter sp.]